jgi:hypothetical protein
MLVIDKKQIPEILPFRNLHYATPVLYEKISPESIVSDKYFIFTDEVIQKLKKDLEN